MRRCCVFVLNTIIFFAFFMTIIKSLFDDKDTTLPTRSLVITFFALSFRRNVFSYDESNGIFFLQYSRTIIESLLRFARSLRSLLSFVVSCSALLLYIFIFFLCEHFIGNN